MPFPLLAAAVPYVGYGLMALSSLIGAGISIYNQNQQNEITRREEDFSRRQNEDYERWLADYERNTGLKPQYPYMGISGQSAYYRQVKQPSYANLYNMRTANMWGSASHAAFGVGMSGAFGYNHYRNKNPYKASESVDYPVRDPSKIGPM